jgi:hypothetical protein
MGPNLYHHSFSFEYKRMSEVIDYAVELAQGQTQRIFVGIAAGGVSNLCRIRRLRHHAPQGVATSVFLPKQLGAAAG